MIYRDDTVLQLTYMMSSDRDHADSERREVEHESDANIICRCTNVCNRAVGRGSCPCLQNDRSCSRLCKCGTAKMGCKNMQQDQSLELPEAYGVAMQPDKVGEEAGAQKEVPQTKGRRGRKRKRGSAEQKHGKARASILEMQSWFSKSNSGEYAFCHLCGCDIKIIHGQTNLLEHVQSEKHARQSQHLGLREGTEEHRQGRYLDDNNLEEIPRFKPWLRLNKITGNPYCLYCRCGILRCKSQEDLEKHRASRRHLTSEKMTRLERKGLGGHVISQLNDNEIANESGTLDSDIANFSGNNPRETELLEERQERDVPEEIDEVGEKIPLFLSTENISKQVKETEAQVVSFIVENRVPLGVTDGLVAMLKRLPTAGTVVEVMELGEEFSRKVIAQTTDDLLNKFLIEHLKMTLFSIAVDYQTDRSGVTYLGIFAVYCNVQFEVQLVLFDLVELKDRSAEMIFVKLKESMQSKEDKGVLLGNWVGFLCNSTNIPFNVMVPLMDMVKQQYPWVMPVVSPCHMGDISFTEAVKHLPPRIEQVCQLIHEHFLSGPVAASFLNYGSFVASRDHRILAGQNLPWSTCNEYVQRLLDQWKMLTIYFTGVEKLRPESENRAILEFLDDPMMKVLLTMLRFLSGVLVDYQTKVEKEEPTFENVNDYTDDLIRTLANHFMIGDTVMGVEDMSRLDVSDEASYLPLPQIYLGFEASGALAASMDQGQQTFEDPVVVEFLYTVREFYKEFIRNLQTSLQFCRPLWRLGRVVDPHNVVTTHSASDSNGDILNSFLASDLVDVKKFDQELQDIQNMTFPDSMTEITAPLSRWTHILNSSTESFHNVRRVILFLFSLPLSSRSTRKIFESLKEWNINIGIRLQMANTGEYLKEHVFIKELFEGHSFEQCKKETGMKF